MEESKVLWAPSRRSRVFEFLDKKPNANITELHFEFPNYKDSLLRTYKWQYQQIHRYGDIHVIKEAICILLEYIDEKIDPESAPDFIKKERAAMKKLMEWSNYSEYLRRNVEKVIMKG